MYKFLIILMITFGMVGIGYSQEECEDVTEIENFVEEEMDYIVIDTLYQLDRRVYSTIYFIKDNVIVDTRMAYDEEHLGRYKVNYDSDGQGRIFWEEYAALHRSITFKKLICTSTTIQGYKTYFGSGEWWGQGVNMRALKNP